MAGALAGSAAVPARPAGDPEEEAVLADSVGLALLVVLDTLTPAERLAFVLHDTFAMPFNEVAAVLGRSPEAARQLASRARRRIRGAPSPDRAPDLSRQREVAAAFLAASRGGDFAALVALLDEEVTLAGDAAAIPSGRPVRLRGVDAVARGAFASSARAGQSRLALVNGSVGIVFAPAGHLQVVLALRVSPDRRITAIDDRRPGPPPPAAPGPAARLRGACPAWDWAVASAASSSASAAVRAATAEVGSRSMRADSTRRRRSCAAAAPAPASGDAGLAGQPGEQAAHPAPVLVGRRATRSPGGLGARADERAAAELRLGEQLALRLEHAEQPLARGRRTAPGTG